MQGMTAAVQLTLALATASSAGLPPQLLSIVSSFRSS